MNHSIGVVIVTFNRLELLKKALISFENQKQLPQLMVIVDNASTDGTSEYLDVWKEKNDGFKKIIYHNKINEGGSGGFHLGMQIAMEQDVDWVWLSDDDAFPEEDALLNATEFIEKHNNEDLSAICAQVINNGKIDKAHRRNEVQKGLAVNTIPIDEEMYDKDYFQLNCFSYVGVIINKEKLKKVGLTNKEYFICYDDSEHSLRLSKVGKIYCVPSIKVHHNVTMETSSLTWKTYYYYRNRINMIKHHFPSYCYRYLALIFNIAAITKLFSKREKIKYKLFRTAVHDGCNDVLGKHDIYKPGWKPEN